MKAKYRNLWEGRYIKISKSLWFFTHLQSVHHRGGRLVRALRKGLSWPKPEVSGNNNLFGKGRQPHPKPAYWGKKNCFLICVLVEKKCRKYCHFEDTTEKLMQLERGEQIRSVAQSCPTLCDPMNRSTPGLPVHHQLPEFTETHVHRVGDAIQPSHPLSIPSASNPSQYQSLFQWVNSSHEVAKVLEFQL